MSKHSIELDPQKEIIIKALKNQWFILASKEDIGKTPDLTKQIDELELLIRRTEKI